MKTIKMSLDNIQGKMSRVEMRNIMAGSSNYPSLTGTRCYAGQCYCDWDYNRCNVPCDMALCGVVGNNC